MNRERIKDLARFCGFDWQRYWDEDEENQIEVFANLIEREVREQQQKVMEQLRMAVKVISIWAKNGSTEKDFDDIEKLANKTLEKVKEAGYDIN